jgi:hypothetical protein
VAHGGLGLDVDEVLVALDVEYPWAASSTCQVITAEISIGLPLASLTLSTWVSRLRIRSETWRRLVSGLSQWNPGLRTVPR